MAPGNREAKVQVVQQDALQKPHPCAVKPHAEQIVGIAAGLAAIVPRQCLKEPVVLHAKDERRRPATRARYEPHWASSLPLGT